MCCFPAPPWLTCWHFFAVKPHVSAYKKSEHGNEKDTGVLVCKSTSYPPVTQWMWFKMIDDGPQLIINGSEDRFFIKSEANKTELRILNLDTQKDPGEYSCNATNELGEGSALVGLRVRSRLAALWPFLGIVAEVLVLVTIIFIYEKRRKPDEVLDALQFVPSSVADFCLMDCYTELVEDSSPLLTECLHVFRVDMPDTQIARMSLLSSCAVAPRIY
ncbi:hypothetical protein lerEdw1_020675 [Lerista edwardsae]|nr:hypothetical protein lerEdw1_020675 [Lerista edwardsae]